MLVLSRKVGQEIRIPEVGVVIRLVESRSSRVQIGIDAPRDLRILRGELEDGPSDTSETRSTSVAMNRLSRWLHSVDPQALTDELAVIDGLIERLIEIRLEAKQVSVAEPQQVTQSATYGEHNVRKMECAATDQVRQHPLGYEVSTGV